MSLTNTGTIVEDTKGRTHGHDQRYAWRVMNCQLQTWAVNDSLDTYNRSRPASWTEFWLGLKGQVDEKATDKTARAGHWEVKILVKITILVTEDVPDHMIL